MKRLLLIFVSVALAAGVLSYAAAPKDAKKDESIASLWDQYEKASEKDQVGKMADILETIKARSLEERSTWDYYKSCCGYVAAMSSRNWKLRNELASAAIEEISAYGEPVLDYLLNREMMTDEERLAFLDENAEVLKSRRNTDVYAGVGMIYHKALLPTVADDYQFVLWDMFNGGVFHDFEHRKVIYDKLSESLGGVYPQAAVAEFVFMKTSLRAEVMKDHEEPLAAFAQEHKGKALEVMADALSIALELAEDKTEGGSSEYFKVMRRRVVDLIRERDSFRDDFEKSLAGYCTVLDDILRHLDAKVAYVDVKDGSVQLRLRNLDKIKVRLLQGKETVFETVVRNPKESYYTLDTLSLDLPALDDGDYRIQCLSGTDELGERSFPKYTLSSAVRQDAGGLAIYVADYMTGEPVDSVDVLLYRNDRKLAEVKGFGLNGFTRLPSEIASRLDERSYGQTLVCLVRGEDGKIRKSVLRNLRSEPPVTEAAQASNSVRIMLERSAYNPGEQVRFKAVVYRSYPDGSTATVPAGQEFIARLVDMNDETLASIALTTNEFGSVAGEFPLTMIKRNGRHDVSIWQGDKELSKSSFIVDEYVLPTFDVSFDTLEQVFFAGDEIVISGILKSYTGHPLSSAKVDVKVSLFGDTVLEETVALGHDGAFSVNFKDVADDDASWREYTAEVKVTDLTGETHMFYHRQPVMQRPYIACTLLNPADGQCSIDSDESGVMMLDQETARICCEAGYDSRNLCQGIPLKYSVLKDGVAVVGGEVMSGEAAELDFSCMEPGLYEFRIVMDEHASDGSNVSGELKKKILWLSSDGTHIDVPEIVENIFHVMSEDRMALHVGAGAGPVWAVVELFGNEKQLLRSEIVYVEKGGMKTIDYEYLAEYPDGVVMNVMYFRKGECYRYSHIWRRPVIRHEVPLELTRFMDETLPGTACTISFRTLPGVEAVASVYDVATDRIYSNPWRTVRRSAVTVRQVGIKDVNGKYEGGRFWEMGYSRPIHRSNVLVNPYSSSDDLWELESSVVVGFGGRAAGIRGTGSVRRIYGSRRSDSLMADAVNEEAVPFQMAESKAGFSGMEGIQIRDSFSAALAFEPFLYPDEDGVVTFSFDASDKLSTYVVSVFAHDKEMNNAVERRDMKVTMPVKLSVVQPQYLYEGDVYVLNASVSSLSSADVAGDMMVEVYSGGTYEGQTPLARYVAEDLEIVAGGSAAESFEIEVPSGVDTLGFKVVFAAGEFSDGMFVKIPFYAADQVIREAHSAVLQAGESEEELVRELRSRFVNGSSMGAEYSSMSVLDMLKASLPLVVEAESKDAVSQSEAVYVNLLAAGLRKEDGEDVGAYAQAARTAMEKVAACVNEDGGIAWFEGMKSSPVVTAVVLGRIAGLRDRGLLELMSSDYSDLVSDAVKYLDSVYFNDSDRPVWYGGLSFWQYLAVRAGYAEVPFDERAARKAVGSGEYREFKTDVKDFLTPARGEAWTDGCVFGKVRMLSILSDLMASQEGMTLARQWGLRGYRMRRSMIRELNSLKEYAAEHPSGGVYYPNAVMPWRGLLESEAYAHAMTCDLFRDLSSDPDLSDGLAEIADGIRLWIMLQKETQAWSADSGFVEAMASVYDASDAVKDTRVVVLSKRFLKPFAEIKEAGNGFKVSVAYYKDGKELQEGDTLTVGDKITARYSLWSEENRSFVRLSVPRAACMRPVDQLSGWTWGWFRPLGYGIFSVTPYSYREVKADKTLYWIDVFPEEESTIEEELFVTQSGVYTFPVAEIESLYAPHYRANDGFGVMMPNVVDRNILNDYAILYLK